MPQHDKKETCRQLLRDMHRKTGELPRKSDFSPEEVMLIKNILGPWPRALEDAGLKAPPDVSRVTLNREKRKAARRRRREKENPGGKGGSRLE